VLSHEDAAMGSVGAVCCVLHLLEHQLLRLRTARYDEVHSPF
jgi:hypothetical protein